MRDRNGLDRADLDRYLTEPPEDEEPTCGECGGIFYNHTELGMHQCPRDEDDPEPPDDFGAEYDDPMPPGDFL
jgi:hypothetical protein